MESLPLYYTAEGGLSMAEERQRRKQKLAAAFRIFHDLGFSEGVAGHITVRDPEYHDRFWVNPAGMSFHKICASDLLLVDSNGQVLHGQYAVNDAAFVIHSAIHAARPDVVAVAHSHSESAKIWSTLGRLLDPITQDSCTFFENHCLFDKFSGVVVDPEQGKDIAHTLGENQVILLRNHGLVSVGNSVDEAVWAFVAFERSCKAQIMAEMVGTPSIIDNETAAHTRGQVANGHALWFMAQPLFEHIFDKYPELLS